MVRLTHSRTHAHHWQKPIGIGLYPLLNIVTSPTDQCITRFTALFPSIFCVCNHECQSSSQQMYSFSVSGMYCHRVTYSIKISSLSHINTLCQHVNSFSQLIFCFVLFLVFILPKKSYIAHQACKNDFFCKWNVNEQNLVNILLTHAIDSPQRLQKKFQACSSQPFPPSSNV